MIKKMKFIMAVGMVPFVCLSAPTVTHHTVGSGKNAVSYISWDWPDDGDTRYISYDPLLYATGPRVIVAWHGTESRGSFGPYTTRWPANSTWTSARDAWVNKHGSSGSYIVDWATTSWERFPTSYDGYPVVCWVTDILPKSYRELTKCENLVEGEKACDSIGDIIWDFGTLQIQDVANSYRGVNRRFSCSGTATVRIRLDKNRIPLGAKGWADVTANGKVVSTTGMLLTVPDSGIDISFGATLHGEIGIGTYSSSAIMTVELI